MAGDEGNSHGGSPRRLADADRASGPENEAISVAEACAHVRVAVSSAASAGSGACVACRHPVGSTSSCTASGRKATTRATSDASRACVTLAPVAHSRLAPRRHVPSVCLCIHRTRSRRPFHSSAPLTHAALPVTCGTRAGHKKSNHLAGISLIYAVDAIADANSHSLLNLIHFRSGDPKSPV